MLHGGSMFLCLSLLAWKGRLDIFNGPLIMELSQVFYNLRRVDRGFMYAFAAAFFIYRWGIIPNMLLQFVRNVALKDIHYPDEEVITPLLIGGGLISNGLNLFWGMKILRIILNGKMR